MKFLLNSVEVDKDYTSERPPDKMFTRAVEICKKQFDGFRSETPLDIFAEYLAKPKQNTLFYERTPTKEEEERGNIKKALWEHYWKEIKREVVKGVAEFYKEKMLENL